MDAEEWTRLAKTKEDLHPDLVPYLDEKDGMLGWPVLKHPLVFQVPHHSNAIANFAYKQKLEALAEASAESRWHSVIWLHERPYRLEALGQLDALLEDDDYWAILSDVWIDSENLWQNLDEWQARLTEDRPGRLAMMDDDEQAALAGLDDPVRVYRGCRLEVNEDGLSWTTDFERAIWFAKRWHHLEEEPVVICGEVEKEHVAAYLLGRGESEIVVDQLDAVKVLKYKEV